MEKLNVPFVPNFMLGVAGGLQYLLFKKAAKSPRKYQEKTLRGILEFAKDTVYGKEHHFAEILQAKDDTELYQRYRICGFRHFRLSFLLRIRRFGDLARNSRSVHQTCGRTLEDL